MNLTIFGTKVRVMIRIVDINGRLVGVYMSKEKEKETIEDTSILSSGVHIVNIGENNVKIIKGQ